MNGVQRYLAPTGLPQALAALGRPGGAIVLAGGTDLMPQNNAGRWRQAATLLNIRRVQGLDAIALDGDQLVLGTLATIASLCSNALVREHAPLLVQAAEHFASDQIRNVASLGGNLCNASPAGDMLTPLLALDAEVDLARMADDGTVARRRLPLAEFFTGPGRTRREATELLLGVRVPRARAGLQWRYYKGGTRAALDIAPIAIAFAARRDDALRLHDVRLALGAVAPTPMRARVAEALLEGARLDAPLAIAAAQAAADEARPIDDVRASAWYRRELLRNMTRRLLDDAAQAEPGHGQSGGLFAPGEGSGHRPDAACKAETAGPPQGRIPPEGDRAHRPGGSVQVRFTLNGVQQQASVELGMSTLTMLRDVIGLTGTKYGCGEGECGACTILVDGVSLNSCLMFAVDVDGRSVITVEGLNADRRGQALLDAFVKHGAVQCGFCTPGMVVQANQLLQRNPRPDAQAAKIAIEGNLCRCTGYQKIVDAIVAAGEALAQEDGR